MQIATTDSRMRDSDQHLALARLRSGGRHFDDLAAGRAFVLGGLSHLAASDRDVGLAAAAFTARAISWSVCMEGIVSRQGGSLLTRR